MPVLLTGPERRLGQLSDADTMSSRMYVAITIHHHPTGKGKITWRKGHFIIKSGLDSFWAVGQRNFLLGPWFLFTTREEWTSLADVNVGKPE